MWAAFGQQAQQQPNLKPTQQLATSTPMATVKPISRTTAKPLGKSKGTPVKAHKPKKAPMAPAPKPLPKPKVQQLTPSQVTKKQIQQHRELANHLHQAFTNKNSANSYPQKNYISNAPVASTEEPISNSYNERDKDDLVIYQRQNPLKPLDLSLQKNHHPS
jgi:hypothetical protein